MLSLGHYVWKVADRRKNPWCNKTASNLQTSNLRLSAYRSLPGNQDIFSLNILHSTAARAIIPKLNRIFSIHGLSQTIRSDNDPPFNCEEIRKYMAENGINHSRITPLWPHANSEVENSENFMKPWQRPFVQLMLKESPGRSNFTSFYHIMPHYTIRFYFGRAAIQSENPSTAQWWYII